MSEKSNKLLDHDNTSFQKIYTKIDNITKATVTLQGGVINDELATVGGKLAQVKIMGENVTLQVFSEPRHRH